uniref:YggT family protein n=1 Tax=Rhizochromulina marina TaxID=1034831 RepID=A0A514CPR9_9STRA|nr:YggT family protein [Rhizochromulina marina]QDH81805.1 YggT family protein [Rhizochromulina marina]
MLSITSQVSELVGDTIQAFALISWILVKVYQLVVELRFLIQWFLNINPYFEPIQSLWVITNPLFNFGRALYPKVLGIDFTPMINYKLLLSLEPY